MVEADIVADRLKHVTLSDVIVTSVENGHKASSMNLEGPSISAALHENQPVTSRVTPSSNPLPNPQFLPLTVRKVYSIADTNTVCHVQVFRDRTVLTCSQLPGGSVATWLLCKPIVSAVPSYPGSKVDLDIIPLLGARDSDVVVFTVLAKQIFSSVGPEATSAPLLLGLGLPKMGAGLMDSRDLFHTIAHLLSGLYVDAVGSMT